MYSKLSLNKVLMPHNSLVFVLFLPVCFLWRPCVNLSTWISSVYLSQRKTTAEKIFQKGSSSTTKNQQCSRQSKVENSFFPPIHPPSFLSLVLFGFLVVFFNSSLAAAVRPTFSPGDDEGRTTAMRRRMKSQARGGEKKINRSSQTKGHLLAWNDNLSCWHKGEDRDKSHSFLRRQRQAPDTGDDSSLCASGLQLQGRFSERKEEIWLTPPGFIK